MPSDISGVEILDENEQERRFRFIEGQFSPISCWRMKSIELLHEHRLLSFKPCRKSKLLWQARLTNSPIHSSSSQLKIQSILRGPIRFQKPNLTDFYSMSRWSTQVRQKKQRSHSITVAVSGLTLFDGSDLLKIQQLVDEVPIAPHVVDWIVQLVEPPRPPRQFC